MSQRKLIFIYNAKGGMLHAALDTLHKVLSPSTYPCELCAITYGWTSMHPDWKKWIDQLTLPAVFLHKDELHGTGISSNMPLPAVLYHDGWEYSVLISAVDWKKIPDVQALVKALENKMTLIEN
ncbi:MAG TPA: hypothetical protein DHW15_09195 [Bacteroidetes bacterium]|nr:MAG: hypothetical protein ABR94_09190 [Sphingobacteriales bacterium BACL12 MAG-120802-bin5]KRP08939.1 MAG: hypothetical protein ABR95_04005 [Sphingobacteriales bacterium BACL12 MAG-120813-bin55]HCK22322.1 hypothetical protein [Bacteroidota bacterium]